MKFLGVLIIVALAAGAVWFGQWNSPDARIDRQVKANLRAQQSLPTPPRPLTEGQRAVIEARERRDAIIAQEPQCLKDFAAEPSMNDALISRSEDWGAHRDALRASTADVLCSGFCERAEVAKWGWARSVNAPNSYYTFCALDAIDANADSKVTLNISTGALTHRGR